MEELQKIIDLVPLVLEHMKETNKRLAELGQRLNELHPPDPHAESDTFTIMAYARIRHVFPLPLSDAIHLGKVARKLSKEKDLPVSLQPDPRFGQVNVYRREVLEEVFQSEFPFMCKAGKAEQE